MKLARVQIENFRHLGSREKPFVLDFTDALGRVRDFTLLVGPNTTGKTTILDAIALALGRTVGMAALRPDFKVSPRTVVRRGELQAKVTCWLRFNTEEIVATRDIFRLAELSEKVPDTPEVKLTWIYPAPGKPSTSPVRPIAVVTGTPAGTLSIPVPGFFSWTPQYGIVSTRNLPPSDYGVIQCEPEGSWVLLHGREQAARLLGDRAGGLGVGSIGLAGYSRSTKSAPGIGEEYLAPGLEHHSWDRGSGPGE